MAADLSLGPLSGDRPQEGDADGETDGALGELDADGLSDADADADGLAEAEADAEADADGEALADGDAETDGEAVGLVEGDGVGVPVMRPAAPPRSPYPKIATKTTTAAMT